MLTAVESIKLISELAEDTESETEVFADIHDITQREFFEADEAGIRPEFKAVIWFDEYDGETIIERGGERYDVYRTYERSDNKIELYAQSRVGI